MTGNITEHRKDNTMTRKEAERLTYQQNVLKSLGFTGDEAEALRRISMTLHRWHELKCGDDHGCIERDEQTGKPYFLYSSQHGCVSDGHRRSYIPDREKGALKRLAKIINARNDRQLMNGQPINVKNPPLLSPYIQTNPLGAALYIIRPGDVPEGEDVSAYYNRGICVY
jgi:hypothetical protein